MKNVAAKLSLELAPHGLVAGPKGKGLRRQFVGGFFLFTGGIHMGIVAAGPEFYAPFADGALFTPVREAWGRIFMAAPAPWGLALSAGEAALGVMLLRGGARAKAGWAGVLAFHLALMLFGWGFWAWSIPALAFLVPAALADWRSAPGAERNSSTQAAGRLGGLRLD
ncbi:hypothetical protein [Arthrobacter sp. DR-2P]|uniref:hypothetical protein n=1 Tax=unclassified Arthrobacter TaxID=235627 RepID=UPI0010DAEEC0|nr:MULTISPECIES: hypothetical protein [unclassified Arthrobacter]VII98552.1 hypothetical protein [Arthrobacter sp. DR-2P]